MPATRKRQAAVVEGDMSKPSAAAAAAAPSTPRRPRPQPQQPLFAPYRALGIVNSPAARPVHQRRGDTSFVTTSAGRSWQVYECGRLTLRAIGPLVSSIDVERPFFDLFARARALSVDVRRYPEQAGARKSEDGMENRTSEES
jgi:hypothetical protein